MLKFQSALVSEFTVQLSTLLPRRRSDNQEKAERFTEEILWHAHKHASRPIKSQ